MLWKAGVGMRRFIRRGAAVLIGVCLVLFLKRRYPQFGARVGNFISGLRSERVRQAFSEMLGALPHEGLGAIEVFYEQVAEG